MNNIVIIYHNDEDGFGGAWAAWKKFKNKADYFKFDYTSIKKSFFNNLAKKEIYFIDACFESEKIMQGLLKRNKIFVIDHHVSLKKYGKISTEYHYSDTHSASVLAWEYFHPEKDIPKLLLYIEDMDLWKFKIKSTREMIASLDTYKFDFKIWDRIAKDLENSKSAKKYINDGMAIIKYQDKLISDLVNDGAEVLIDGKKAIAVNSPILQSEIGHYIYKKKNKIGLIWYLKNGDLKISLRSEKPVDVSKIAQKFGGGGHKQSSGFSFELKGNFPWQTMATKYEKVRIYEKGHDIQKRHKSAKLD